MCHNTANLALLRRLYHNSTLYDHSFTRPDYIFDSVDHRHKFRTEPYYTDFAVFLLQPMKTTPFLVIIKLKLYNQVLLYVFVHVTH